MNSAVGTVSIADPHVEWGARATTNTLFVDDLVAVNSVGRTVQFHESAVIQKKKPWLVSETTAAYYLLLYEDCILLSLLYVGLCFSGTKTASFNTGESHSLIGGNSLIRLVTAKRPTPEWGN